MRLNVLKILLIWASNVLKMFFFYYLFVHDDLKEMTPSITSSNIDDINVTFKSKNFFRENLYFYRDKFGI